MRSLASLSTIILAASLTLHTQQAKAAEPAVNASVVVSMHENGMVSDMTGSLVSVRGHTYVLTARHGFLSDTGALLVNKYPIELHDFAGRDIGSAHVVACDTHAAGSDTDAIVRSDICVLSPDRDLSAYAALTIPSKLPDAPITTCHSGGVMSWEHGSSGSGLQVGSYLIGVLSVSSDEKFIPIAQWRSLLHNRHMVEPKQIMQTYVTETQVAVSSCATFAQPSDTILRAMHIDPSAVQRTNVAQDWEFREYDNYSLPKLRQLHITGYIDTKVQTNLKIATIDIN